MLHRHIDGFTDRHPVNRDLGSLFPAHLRRYRGICLDLFWDYCLSQTWNVFHNQQKVQFIQHHYAVLQAEMQTLREACSAEPVKHAEVVLCRMIESDWLTSYEDMANVHLALQRIGQRLSKPVPLQEAVEVLATHESTMQSYFAGFFPEAINFSIQTVGQLTSASHPK
jgi:acyl carrier protein phosphodiesterase